MTYDYTIVMYCCCLLIPSGKQAIGGIGVQVQDNTVFPEVHAEKVRNQGMFGFSPFSEVDIKHIHA